MAITATISGGDVQLSGNPVWIQCTGGSAPANSSGYKILLQVISEDGKLDGAPFTDAITPNSSGEAWFNISGYVNQPVDAVFEWPVATAVVSYPTQAFNVQVKTGEQYIDENGDLQTTWGATSSIFQILKGGLSQRQINTMNDAATNFYDEYIVAGKFLTARPNGEFVHPTQPVKLWYMVAEDKQAVFKINVVYDDGSSSLYTSSQFTAEKDSLYEFNCNPDLLGEVSFESGTKKAAYFDVWIDFPGNDSDTRRFHVDWNYCERPAFLFFANTFGGVDDVYMGGYIKDKFETSGSEAYQPAQRDDTVYDPTLIVTNKTGRNKWSINTGYKSLTHIQFLRDLLISRQAWYIYSNLSQSTNSVVPIVIENADRLLLNRKENLYSLDIDFSEAHNSKFSFDNRIF